MIQRILTALVLIPLVLLLILRAPTAVLAIVAGIVALLAIREFLQLARHYAVEPFTVGTYIFTGLFFGALAVHSGTGQPGNDQAPHGSAFMVFSGVFAALAPFIFLAVGMRRQKLASAYPAAAVTVFAFAYIAIPMGMLVDLRQSPAGGITVLYLMLVVWSGDIFAYFVGKSRGRHKMSPRVSPGKTWEGAAASLLASVGIGVLLSVYAAPISSFLVAHGVLVQRPGPLGLPHSALGPMIVLSAVLNVASQVGDLVESAIKRGADVKDSGAILPGHGGMLDRIDAMLFAAPVLWFVAAGHPLLFPWT